MSSVYRCARCGRPIQKGREKMLDGKPYGSFCFDREISRREFWSRLEKDRSDYQGNR